MAGVEVGMRQASTGKEPHADLSGLRFDSAHLQTLGQSRIKTVFEVVADTVFGFALSVAVWQLNEVRLLWLGV